MLRHLGGDLFQKIQETIERGGTGILMQGGLHPELKIEWYEDLLRYIKKRFPIHLHCFSSPEILNIASLSGLSIRDTLARLRDAGLDSIPGGGAEILDDQVRRRVSPLKCTTAQWAEVHRVAHSLGMSTTATMMFGCGETLDERVNHLDVVRRIQEETGGFTAFIPWTFQKENTALGRSIKHEATAVEYLKTLAVSRLYLAGHPQRAGLLGDAGAETLPDRAALRGQRRGQRHDRGERGGRGRRAQFHHRRGTAPDHPRRRLPPQAAGHSVSHALPGLGRCREDSPSYGEFYTPPWLARLILDESGYDGAPGRRFLDPSCGPGVFLVLAIERAKAYGKARGEAPGATARRIVRDIQGFDLNPHQSKPLAGITWRRWASRVSEAPVHCLDAILQPPACEKFDYVIGNPPWVRWDYLPREYREATLPLWKRYGLFSLTGYAARLGGGKKDLSMLFTYAAADYYLKDGGTLGFLITQEVFKSKGAGEGFRRFHLGEDGPPLRVQSVHDFVALRPFKTAANKTAAIFLTKGEETTYPVPTISGNATSKARSASRPWRLARWDRIEDHG